MLAILSLFFFSSRRRHTRFDCDWSSDVCSSDLASAMHLQARYAQRYVGRWKVAHGDTLTLPQLGDRFKLSDVLLDTTRLVVGRTCRFRGTLVFTVPRDTLAVTWIGFPEQALIYGWPAQLDRKSTRLNSSHSQISYAVFCLKKKKKLKNRHYDCD